MGGDNAPINITRRAITFIYLYSSPEGGTRGGGGGGWSSFIYDLSS